MRRWAFAAIGALFVMACQDAPTPTEAGDDLQAPLARVSGGSLVDVIVVLDQSFAPGAHAANQSRAREIARSFGVTPRLAYGTALFGFAASVPAGRLNALRRDPRVLYVEPDGIASIPVPRKAAPKKCADNPNGPGCGGGEDDGGSGGQTTPWGITRVGEAADGTGMTAWIIDTGIDLDHADLNVDVERSVNFVTRGRNSPNDGNGHGTHVAGTVAAINNSIDVVGVAAGAKVVAVRVLDNSGSGFYSWVIAGVDYVAANYNPGNVANMSLGGGHNQAMHNVVKNAAIDGLKFSIAAGNSGANALDNSEPAHVEHGNIYTVSAIDDNDRMPSWSNYGNPPVDYAAPGVSVLSTKKGGGTTTLSGTSMAAPHMAGILLLVPPGKEPGSDGTALNDPDGNPDPIAQHF